jgi:PPOX class probable F420-dependent enzyme
MPEALASATAISPEIRDWLLEGERYPVMATIADDGMPSQSVVWFDLVPGSDDTVLLNTLLGRHKDQHLRRDNRLSLCFEDRYDYVTLEGTAELIDDRERALGDIKHLARRYASNPEKFNGQQRVTILMRVHKVIRHE